MPVQRFRLTYARGPDAPHLNQRDQQAAWADALATAGLAVAAMPEPAKLVPAAPIPVGVTCDHELADLFLPTRRTAADVRERLERAMPAGHRLVDLHDVWLGAPALPAMVAAVDYVVEVADDGGVPDPALLSAGVAAVLAASVVDRARGGNLRPLIQDLRVDERGTLRMRLTIDANTGTGRPEDVVAAIAARTGHALEITRRHRERLWLRDELPAHADRD
jgi:radical SAM-linked protein